MKNLIINVFTIIVVIALVFGFGFLLASAGSPTDGKASGYVTAVEKNGVFWKTYQVYVKSDLRSSQEDIYCVEDQAIITTLMAATESAPTEDSPRISFDYSRGILVAPWRCDNEQAIVTSVK